MSLIDAIVPADKHTLFLLHRRRKPHKSLRSTNFVGKTMEEVIDNDIIYTIIIIIVICALGSVFITDNIHSHGLEMPP